MTRTVPVATPPGPSSSYPHSFALPYLRKSRGLGRSPSFPPGLVHPKAGIPPFVSSRGRLLNGNVPPRRPSISGQTQLWRLRMCWPTCLIALAFAADGAAPTDLDVLAPHASGVCLAEVLRLSRYDERPRDGNMGVRVRFRAIRSSGQIRDTIDIVEHYGGLQEPRTKVPPRIGDSHPFISHK